MRMLQTYLQLLFMHTPIMAEKISQVVGDLQTCALTKTCKK